MRVPSILEGVDSSHTLAVNVDGVCTVLPEVRDEFLGFYCVQCKVVH